MSPRTILHATETMDLSYQHPSPTNGKQSTLLRIEGFVPEQSVRILIDAGEGVDVDALLDERDDDHLDAICLTHAHLDHYHSLGTNLRDGAPVYASTDTARILSNVFDAGGGYHDLPNTDAVLERLEPIDEWTQIVPGVRVHPVPAGHAPGAAGFLFVLEDGDERRTVLATGDFTTRRTAGYTGLPLDLLVDIDVLLLTAATNEEFTGEITDAIGTLAERARAGSRVLATAGGLTGLHAAYLLGHAVDTYGEPVPVTVVGQVATLYDRLEYDIPNVEAVAEFEDPARVLTRGGVTIAGPEDASAGSAGHLFEVIRDDAGATLVQLLSGGGEPIDGERCTTYHFSVSNHPPREQVDDVVDAYEPWHVIITHQTGRAADEYKDCYDSYVWATDDREVYTLLDETGWTPPHWVTEITKQRVRQANRSVGQTLGGALPPLDDDVDLPSVARGDDVDLAAEGLDIDALQARLAGRPAPEHPDGSDGAAREEPPTAATAGDGSGVVSASVDASSTDADLELTLNDIDSRLERVETALAGQEYSARVVDAGDGTILLRLDDPPAELEHGQEVNIRLPADDILSGRGP